MVTAPMTRPPAVGRADGAAVVLQGHEDRVWSAVFSPDGRARPDRPMTEPRGCGTPQRHALAVSRDGGPVPSAATARR